MYKGESHFSPSICKNPVISYVRHRTLLHQWQDLVRSGHSDFARGGLNNDLFDLVPFSDDDKPLAHNDQMQYQEGSTIKDTPSSGEHREAEMRRRASRGHQ